MIRPFKIYIVSELKVWNLYGIRVKCLRFKSRRWYIPEKILICLIFWLIDNLSFWDKWLDYLKFTYNKSEKKTSRKHLNIYDLIEGFGYNLVEWCNRIHVAGIKPRSSGSFRRQDPTLRSLSWQKIEKKNGWRWIQCWAKRGTRSFCLDRVVLWSIELQSQNPRVSFIGYLLFFFNFI